MLPLEKRGEVEAWQCKTEFPGSCSVQPKGGHTYQKEAFYANPFFQTTKLKKFQKKIALGCEGADQKASEHLTHSSLPLPFQESTWPPTLGSGACKLANNPQKHWRDGRAKGKEQKCTVSFF